MTVELDVVRGQPIRQPAGRASVVISLTGHAIRAFFRTPIAAFFTLIFPLLFLVIVNAAVGDSIVQDGSGVRVSQFLVAPFAVFGVAEAAFSVLAIDVAILRESGILKRLRATPAPAWLVLTSRIASAVVVSLLSVCILVVVGVTVYGVEPVWRKAPAAIVTLVLGIACFAALGLALVSLTRSVLAAQTLSNGLLVPLAFISNVFMVGVDLPVWLDWLGRALPLRHFADAMSATFNPYHPGTAFSWRDLAVMAAWTVAGAAVAWARFGWEPRGGGTVAHRRHEAHTAAPAGDDATGPRTEALAVHEAGRPSSFRLVAVQAGHALVGMRRDSLSVFFAVVFPVLLLLLFPRVMSDVRFEGLALSDFMVPAMVAYALAVIGYVNTPQGLAQIREQRVLQRLQGTPAPLWTFFAGRLVGTFAVAAMAAVLLTTVAVTTSTYRLDPVRVPAALVAFALGVACFSALGFLLVRVVRSAQSLTAITLGTLLPVCFVSDIFIIGGELPGVLRGVGDVLPLKHVMHALLTAMRPDGSGMGIAVTDLLVVAAWTVVVMLAALRFPVRET